MLDFAYAFCSLQVVFHILIKEKEIKKNRNTIRVSTISLGSEYDQWLVGPDLGTNWLQTRVDKEFNRVGLRCLVWSGNHSWGTLMEIPTINFAFFSNSQLQKKPFQLLLYVSLLLTLLFPDKCINPTVLQLICVFHLKMTLARAMNVANGFTRKKYGSSKVSSYSILKVRKRAMIRNRYSQAPHLT